MKTMKVLSKFISSSPLKNFNHIVVNNDETIAIVIDPMDLDWIEEETKGIEKVILMNTHTHFDHIAQNENFLERSHAEFMSLEDKESFQLSETERIEAFFTPGHLHNHYCFSLHESDEVSGIITGDTLFNCGVGNCKNGGNVQQLYKTTKIFESYGDEVFIYPSHDYFLTNLNFAKSIDRENSFIDNMIQRLGTEGYFFTNLGQERKMNPFLRLGELTNYFPDKNEEEIFIQLRKKRDNW